MVMLPIAKTLEFANGMTHCPCALKDLQILVFFIWLTLAKMV